MFHRRFTDNTNQDSVVSHLRRRCFELFTTLVNNIPGVVRIGRYYNIQTPNPAFPLEPYFFFPGFQFLPLAACVWLVRHFSLSWLWHIHRSHRWKVTDDARN